MRALFARSAFERFCLHVSQADWTVLSAFSTRCSGGWWRIRG